MNQATEKLQKEYNLEKEEFDQIFHNVSWLPEDF